jgi:hypothetical protein
MMPNYTDLERALLVARCHEIQAALNTREVADFESIIELGMAVRLALHLRGITILLNYETVKLVAHGYLNIPRLAVDRVVRLLEHVGFVSLVTTGKTIDGVLPKVPYYEDLYDQLGEYAHSESKFTEAEQLALVLVDRLAAAPENIDSLRNVLGADASLFTRGIQTGSKGGYLIPHRTRGRDILLNPTYFSQNSDVFADAVAAQGATSIKRLLETIKVAQGWPLALIEQQGSINGVTVTPEQLGLLKRLAQDGAVKPPSITTTHKGENFFIFTPTPAKGALSPTKRDIYERAMAIVASIRQGQLLPEKFAIRNPGAIIATLRDRMRLGRATTEATQQYRKLVDMRIARLTNTGYGYAQLEIINEKENIEALDIAASLINAGSSQSQGLEVDDDARQALQQDLKYVESLVSAREMREREHIALHPQQQEEIDLALMGVLR